MVEIISYKHTPYLAFVIVFNQLQLAVIWYKAVLFKILKYHLFLKNQFQNFYKIPAGRVNIVL